MIFTQPTPISDMNLVIVQTNRPFSHTQDMDEVLICRWNKVVSDDIPFICWVTSAGIMCLSQIRNFHS